MGVLHSINHQDIKIYDSECGLYKDFILKNKVELVSSSLVLLFAFFVF